MIHLAVQGLARRRGRAAAAIVGIALAVALAYVMAGHARHHLGILRARYGIVA